MEKIRILSLFSGLGAFEEALKNLNIETEIVGFSEIDKYAIKSYSILNNISEKKNLGDIKNINPTDIKEFDLMTYGFPCQDISVIGNQNGLEENSETRSSLVWDIFKIIEHHKPKYLIGENVKNLLSEKFKDDFLKLIFKLEELGYKTFYKVLNSKNFGVPQNRERVYIVSIWGGTIDSFKFNNSTDDTKKLIDVLELNQEYNSDYYLKDFKSIINKKSVFKERFEVLNPYRNIGRCLTTKSCKGSITNTFVVDIYGVRGLTERECFKLQGFNPDYVKILKENGISKNQLYKLIGNSITVPVLENIFKNLLEV